MNMGFDEVSPGYIGYHPIGGGSAMMGLDVLNHVGLKPANYADTSGNPVGSKIYRVAKCVLSQPNIDGYLLGGFMMANRAVASCACSGQSVMRDAAREKTWSAVRFTLCGNKEEESLAILRKGLAELMTPDGPGRRIEIYGKEHVTDTLFIGQRLLELSKAYHLEKVQGKENG